MSLQENVNRRKHHGYWILRCKEHPRANKDGYMREHRLVMEKHLGRYLESYEHIHHIDGNKLNNDINNLTIVSRSSHNSIHKKGNINRLNKHIDSSDRVCFNCKSNTTAIYKPKGTHKTPYPQWYHLPWDKENWYCKSCNQKLKNLQKRGDT